MFWTPKDRLLEAGRCVKRLTAVPYVTVLKGEAGKPVLVRCAYVKKPPAVHVHAPHRDVITPRKRHVGAFQHLEEL